MYSHGQNVLGSIELVRHGSPTVLTRDHRPEHLIAHRLERIPVSFGCQEIEAVLTGGLLIPQRRIHVR
jgi:uncharacterized protein (DUF2249 family)